MPLTGDAKKVMASMVEQYGPEKGKQVFYATANKQRREERTWKKKACFVAGKVAAELSTEAREKLPKSEFAIPEERAYPIEDKAHARNALARVSQHGTPEEKARVRRKVHQEYPAIGEEKKSCFVAGKVK